MYARVSNLKFFL